MTDVTKVVFSAANTNGLNVVVSYSTDSGLTWTGEQIFTLGASSQEYTYDLNVAGVPQARMRFQITTPGSSPTATSRICIDDVAVFGLR